MLHVETVDLRTRHFTLPGDKVAMIMAQPHLKLGDTEPYRTVTAHQPEQMAMLTATLDLALARPHELPKTHFTIFPEYGIPGVDGVALIQARVSDPSWPEGTIVMGGTDGLTQAEFTALAGAPHTHVVRNDNLPVRVGVNEWINCAVIWVKSAQGVERWLQPKIHPARAEQDIQFRSMFQGNGAFVFRGLLDTNAPFFFSMMTCFDWIASVDGRKIWRHVVEHLAGIANVAGLPVPMSWCFVLQHNPKPSHVDFLHEVKEFFNQTNYVNVLRERACVVFANTAGKDKPGMVDQYGSSSLIFPPQSLFIAPTCAPTFSNGGPMFRSSPILATFKDTVFREGGACIHSLVQVNPGSIPPGVANLTFAIEKAAVFPIPDLTDPRAPRSAVPADVKWLNDQLDSEGDLGSKNRQLTTVIDRAHRDTVAQMRAISTADVSYSVELAIAKPCAEHADAWTEGEADGLKNLVDTFDILRLGGDVEMVGQRPAHGTVMIDGHPVDVIAVRGKSHVACYEHAMNKIVAPRLRRHTLLISRDDDNDDYRKSDGPFLDREKSELGEEIDITNPASAWLHIGFRAVLDGFKRAADVPAFQTSLHAALS